MMPARRASAIAPLRVSHTGLAVMHLALDVVVVAVDRLVGRLERRQVAMQRVDHQLHHLGAIDARVSPAPVRRVDVIVEVLRALGEVGEVAIGQLELRALGVPFGQSMKLRADGVANTAAPECRHHPRAALLVQADLDEVIAAAERAELVTQLVRLLTRLPMPGWRSMILVSPS